MPKPSPAVTIRQRLIAARRNEPELPFETVWEAALRGGGLWPHLTEDRRQWKEAMAETKEAWRAAYDRQEVAGGRALVALAAALRDADDDHEPNHRRVPLIPALDSRVSSPQAKREKQQARKQRENARRRERRRAA